MAQQIRTNFLEDLAITTAKIAAASVTGAKIESSVALAGAPTAATAAFGTNTTQIATTAFVQSGLSALDSGLKPKQAVRFAVSTNIDLSEDLVDAASLGGVTAATGDRALLYGQNDPAENGIYIVAASGAASRATDFDSLSPVDEITRAWVPVQEGTHAGKVFVQYGTVTTLGTDDINFTFYDPIASLIGGDMITVSGSTIAVNLASVSGLESSNPGNAAGQLRIKLEASNPTLLIDGSNQLGIKLNTGATTGNITTSATGIKVDTDNDTIETASNALRVKDLGITNAKIANTTIDLTTKVTGILPVANGGTGADTLTANSLLVGAGTDAVTFIAPGTTGNILTSNGTTWVSQAPATVYAWAKESITLDGTDITNQYIDLAEEVQASSIIAFVGRLALHHTTDFTVSVEGGVTRLTLAGSVATAGSEALEAGDVLFVTYQY
jgi:hypothetical protein